MAINSSSQVIADRALRENLQELGFSAGPVTDTTREVLVRKLRRLSLTKADQPSSERKEEPNSTTCLSKSQPKCSVTTKKDLFLSYSRDVDRNNFVKQLKKDLESNGYSVFMDTEDIGSGSDWHSVIGAAVNNSKAMISVVSAKYMTSHYCRSELFMASHVKKPIFPILVEEVDFSGTEEAGVLLAIASLNWVSLTGSASYRDGFSELLKGLKHQGIAPSS